MSSPEHGHHGGDAKPDLMKRLAQFFRALFQNKAEKEMAERAAAGEIAKRDYAKHETEAKWEEERRKREERDRTRKYHEARSAEVAEAEVEVTRRQNAQKVRDKLQDVINDTSGQNDIEGSRYLMAEIRGNTHVQEALKHLIDESPNAREVIREFLTQDKRVHGRSRELIKLTQALLYEAQKTGDIGNLDSFITQVKKQIDGLLIDEYSAANRAARGRRGQGFNTFKEFLEEEPGIVMTDDEQKELQTPVYYKDKDNKDTDRVNETETTEKWKRIVQEMVTEPRVGTVRAFTAAKVDKFAENYGGNIPDSQVVIDKMVAPLDRVWGELERKDVAGQLTSEDLIKYSRQLVREESQIRPTDVAPGSDAYFAASRAMGDYMNNKLEILAKKLEEKLKAEKVVMKEGINDETEFLAEMAKRKGRIGDLFELNPAMEELLYGLDDKSRKFRDRVFMNIHSRVLSDQRNSSNDNFGLYERADFSTIIDLLKVGLEKFKVMETGRSLGETLSDHYNNLSNAIRQCRDIDFWASQPAANSENFNKSLGMFQNEYVKEALNIPGVIVAFRAFEDNLRSIIASNDGYLPPALMEYDATSGRSFWDNMSRAQVEKMVGMGVVPGIKRDERNYYLHVRNKDGYSVEMDFKNPLKKEDVSSDEYLMYMTLAKGIGMATARYLEMIAQTKVPGSDNPTLGLDTFHSMPYEGMAKAMNYFNVYIEKWKMGSYKYGHLMNMLIPDEKNRMTIDQNDSTSAIRAYMAYQDGTFEEKFGTDAKRFIDLTNFSGISSAIGKDTTWRQYDMTLDWEDRKKEFLGGPTQLVLSKRYAEEKVKDHLVVAKYREQYRQELISQKSGLPTSGAGFDKLWREYGKNRYAYNIEKEWEKLNGLDPKKGRQHTALWHQTDHLIGAYRNALKARVWVEMAMRNPLVVAHSLKVDLPLVGGEKRKKQMTLHTMLVQDILGIPPEDTKYGEEVGKSATRKSPTKQQEQYMIDVMNLEWDLAAVREKAINGEDTEYVRDLTDKDFKVIGDEKRKEQALAYWRRVKKVILGSEDSAEADRLIKHFGLGLMENQVDYEWDHHHIHELMTDKKDGFLDKLDKQLNQSPMFTIVGSDGQQIEIPFLLKKAVKMEPEWILGTDDMVFNKMDILNLGSRQLIRRGGDIAAHQAGGDAVIQYLLYGLTPTPNKEEAVKLLAKLRDAYSGDMIEIGWSVGSNLAYMTDRLYAWDWNHYGQSVAQRDVWGTRRGVASWLANERREWWDTLEHADVFPPNAHSYFYNIDDKVNIHTMRKWCHADNSDVWKEIIALGVLLALAITIYRAFTAPSEEEEGGGKGGHH